MKTILLPTDFSKNSINAINYAMELYRNTLCNFYLLHVKKTSSFISDDVMMANASETIYETIVDPAKKSLFNIIKKIKQQYSNDKHHFEAIVDYDNFIDSINQVSEKFNVDLIIMGTKGASGLTKVLFGSNTEHVINRGNVPVLAIPDNCKFSGLEKVAFTTSFSRLYTKEELDPLADILSLNYSKLYVLHVFCDFDFSEELSNNIDFFKAIFKYPFFKYLDVKDDDVYKTLHQFTTTNTIKMIAMSRGKHSFFERLFNSNTFKNIAFNIDIPFLVMKSN